MGAKYYWPILKTGHHCLINRVPTPKRLHCSQGPHHCLHIRRGTVGPVPGVQGSTKLIYTVLCLFKQWRGVWSLLEGHFPIKFSGWPLVPHQSNIDGLYYAFDPWNTSSISYNVKHQLLILHIHSSCDITSLWRRQTTFMTKIFIYNNIT